MYASDAEMKEILDSRSESRAAEAPSSGSPFGSSDRERDVPSDQPRGFSDMSPPPSPFSGGDSVELEPVAPPPGPGPDARSPEPAFDEAATIIQSPLSGGMAA